MICKWCGAAIDIAKGKCPVCGREPPAVAECGGFYDVVPKATRPQAPQGEEKPAGEPPEAAQGKGKAHALLLIVSLALILILGLVMMLRIAALSKRIAALEQRNAESSERVEQPEQSVDATLMPTEQQASQPAPTAQQTQPPATEPVTQEEEPQTLSGQELYFAVDFTQETPELDSEPPWESGEFHYDTADEAEKEADYWLNGVLLWEASVREEASASPAGRAFSFNYDVDSDQLGSYRSAEFIWEYSRPSDTQWLSFQARDFIGSNDNPAESRSTITIAEAWLAQNFPRGGELRCTLVRRSEDGGTLELCFTLSVNQEERTR